MRASLPLLTVLLAPPALAVAQPQGGADDAAVPAAATTPPPAIRPPPAPPPIVRLNPTPPAAVSLSRDGRSVLIDGEFGPGTAASFARILEAAPGVRTIVLHSVGGLLGEAAAMADIVRQRRLDTYVETGCLSACTMVLLAGVDRATLPTARIGFHRPTFPDDISEAQRTNAAAAARAFYDEAGVLPSFTDRLFATPNAEMWFPSYAELLAANVVTRRTLGGETSVFFSQIETIEQLRASFGELPYWAALAERHPTVADRAVESAWQARQRGASDAEVAANGRAVLANFFPEVIRAAQDPVLIDHVRLFLDQIMAARALGYDACNAYLDAQLMPSALPAELAERESELIRRALVEPPSNQAPLATERMDTLLHPIFAAMPPDQVAAIAAPNQAASPARCDGIMAVYRGISRLEPGTQAAIVRSMLQRE